MGDATKQLNEKGIIELRGNARAWSLFSLVCCAPLFFLPGQWKLLALIPLAIGQALVAMDYGLLRHGFSWWRWIHLGMSPVMKGLHVFGIVLCLAVGTWLWLKASTPDPWDVSAWNPEDMGPTEAKTQIAGLALGGAFLSWLLLSLYRSTERVLLSSAVASLFKNGSAPVPVFFRFVLPTASLLVMLGGVVVWSQPYSAAFFASRSAAERAQPDDAATARLEAAAAARRATEEAARQDAELAATRRAAAAEVQRHAEELAAQQAAAAAEPPAGVGADADHLTIRARRRNPGRSGRVTAGGQRSRWSQTRGGATRRSSARPFSRTCARAG